MATWTKHPAPHRGESRRCGWYSSSAFALGGGFTSRGETKSQTGAVALPDVSENVAGIRAAGPPG